MVTKKLIIVVVMGLAIVLGTTVLILKLPGVIGNKKLVLNKKLCLLGNSSYLPGTNKMIQMNEGCVVCSCISGPEFSCIKQEGKVCKYEK